MFSRGNRVVPLEMTDDETVEEERDAENEGNLWLRYRYGEVAESMNHKQEADKIGLFVKTPPISARKDRLFADPVKAVNGCSAWRYHQKVQWRRCKLSVKEFSHHLELWGGLLRTIEGRHGTGVVSYFVLLRWLLGLNTLLLLLLVIFLVVPMGVFPARQISTASPDLAYNCSQNYTVSVSADVATLVLDIFQGTGWMEKTLMFYGYYAGSTLISPIANHLYNLPLAYVLVALAVLVVSLVMMAQNAATNVKNSVVELRAGSENMRYCNKVFGVWDYTMTDEKSAKINHSSIHYEIASCLREQKFHRNRRERLKSCCGRCGLYTARALINFIILVLLAAAGATIYFTQTFSTSFLSSVSPSSDVNRFLLLLVSFLPSLVITGLNSLLPLLFELLVKGEDYTQNYIVQITLLRTVFLRLASLAVLIVTLLSQITCSSRDSCLNILRPKCINITCWETYVGQQFYKLAILDFVVAVLKIFLVEFPRKLLYKCCHKKFDLVRKIGPPEFDVAQNVLDLVYTQTLCWLGFFFCPLIPGITVISMFLLFYMKFLAAMLACQPSQHPYRAARSNSFFMMLLMAAYFLCCFPVGYTISSLEPSRMCGPFRRSSSMYDPINRAIESWPQGLATLYNIIFSPAFTACVILLLLLIIYYRTVVGSAYEESAKIFKDQVQQEGRDKRCLQMKIRELSGERNIPYSSRRKNMKTLQSAGFELPSQPSDRGDVPGFIPQLDPGSVREGDSGNAPGRNITSQVENGSVPIKVTTNWD